MVSSRYLKKKKVKPKNKNEGRRNTKLKEVREMGAWSWVVRCI